MIDKRKAVRLGAPGFCAECEKLGLVRVKGAELLKCRERGQIFSPFGENGWACTEKPREGKHGGRINAAPGV